MLASLSEDIASVWKNYLQLSDTQFLWDTILSSSHCEHCSHVVLMQENRYMYRHGKFKKQKLKNSSQFGHT